MKLNSDDLLVSLDVVSLFTRVPVHDVLKRLEETKIVDKYVVELARHCLLSTYFIYEGNFYKQVSGAPMGSPLSPVIANLYMQEFEEKALISSPFKPKCWLRYVDDTFLIWQHGEEKLHDFLAHFNSIHPDIQFTMEIEAEGKLSFLDVLITKKTDLSLGHSVYRKPTHTNRYLHASSHHHPSQIRSVAYTLATRSKRIVDGDHAEEEFKILREGLILNGFPNRVIQHAMKRKTNAESNVEKEEPHPWAYLPYVKGVTDRISKILMKSNIKTIFNTDKKIGELLRSGKDKIHLEGSGVYEIPCANCSKCYVGQTGRNTFQRKQEHRLAVDQNQHTSALAQHVQDSGHTINFSGMKMLAPIDRLLPRLVREAIEIEKRVQTLNKQTESQRLSDSWKPIIQLIRVVPTEPPATIRYQTDTVPPGQSQGRSDHSCEDADEDDSSETTNVTNRRGKKPRSQAVHSPDVRQDGSSDTSNVTNRRGRKPRSQAVHSPDVRQDDSSDTSNVTNRRGKKPRSQAVHSPDVRQDSHVVSRVTRSQTAKAQNNGFPPVPPLAVPPANASSSGTRRKTTR